LALVDNPTERKRHEPGPRIGCGASLAEAPDVGIQCRQVFELPLIAVRVPTTTSGVAPEGVTAPVQYGSRVTAIILYLYAREFLPKKRTAQALAELFGTPVSEGTVTAMTKRATDGLDEFLSQSKPVAPSSTRSKADARTCWAFGVAWGRDDGPAAPTGPRFSHQRPRFPEPAQSAWSSMTFTVLVPRLAVKPAGHRPAAVPIPHLDHRDEPDLRTRQR
jgi:hypothetical protein